MNLDDFIKEAKQKHGDQITFCGNCKSWSECFTICEMKQKTLFLFYYNVGVNTYGILKEEVKA